MKKLLLLAALFCVGCGETAKGPTQRHKEIINHLEKIEKKLERLR